MDPFGIGPGPTITLGLALIGLIGWGYNLRSDVAAGASKCKRLEERVETQEKALSDYKLYVADTYVRQRSLDDMEARMGKRVDDLAHEIRQMPGRFSQTVKDVLGMALRKGVE